MFRFLEDTRNGVPQWFELERGWRRRCGAVYCSLGRYSISPSLLKFLLQTWNPETNTFISVDGERTITLLDMLRIGGLPIDGEFYEEFVPSRSERDPSLLSYPSILYRDF